MEGYGLGLRLGLALVLVNYVWASGDSVVWTSIGEFGQRGSMPLGNGDVSSNVWLDTSNVSSHTTKDVMFYIAKGDAWDENGQLLKVGRVRMHLEPAVSATGFSQRLELSTGSVVITDGEGYSIRAYVDANSPTVRVMVNNSQREFTLQVTLEVYRNQTVLDKGDYCQPRYKAADVVLPSTKLPPVLQHGVVWYHRNDYNSTFWRDSLELQGLGAAIPHLHDPLTNGTFGGILAATGCEVHGTTLACPASRSAAVEATIAYAQTDTVAEWISHLASTHVEHSVMRDDARASEQKSYKAHVSWWAAFWVRSYVNISAAAGQNATQANEVGLKYAIQRFLDACDGRNSASPIKFNGQSFTVDEDFGPAYGPDYRDWGQGYWWQNTRIPYYNMLAAGDLDMLRPLYAFYSHALALTRARTELYFNHSGGYYVETMTLFGTFDNGGYGWGCQQHANHLATNSYMRYHIVGSLELVHLMLDDYKYTGDEAIVTKYLLPVADAVLTFYREHFPARDAQNKTVFFPTQALETWQCPDIPPRVDQCVTNPTPDLAGLHNVLPRMLALPRKFGSASQRAAWASQLEALPDITLKSVKGNQVIWPGRLLPNKTSNSENVELYAVHPFRLFDRTKLGQNTYKVRRFPCNDGWCQDVVDAALLNMTDDAYTMVAQRAAYPPPQGWRFDGFAPHLQDYEPSADHYSFMRTAMHYMLLTPGTGEDRRISLFPTWPTKVWDVSFKLHAPFNTTVQASCVGNVLTSLVVEPADRKQDIVFVGCTG